MKSFKHILVPTDFSESSRAALEVALSFAKVLDSELMLLHTWDIPIYPYLDLVPSSADLTNAIKQAATKRLAEELERVKQVFPRAKSVLARGLPWQQILETSKQLQPDLIVMGTHGRHGVNHALMGSVAEKVVRLAEVPVLTVHAPKAS
jgi:nucleotide-binding universal stress UspA family protein